VRARRATTADVEAIARVCSDGWRDAYKGLLTDDEIETTSSASTIAAGSTKKSCALRAGTGGGSRKTSPER
jgi:hypothetical protein